ncbi:Hypothetical protein SRAE_1000030500 [Strongyloides ratti]|uniref:Uncharacterized protein n=1 Tax=Strongyloides ratti TaxID=34506 RepID=A0A090L3F4_STRRB|nr:Hypothetical protein SRAE_1000030500 [Strongyloides ratti]CEF62029.1 Hypothetical protein SRAE_1000030500 [Strongyloides ratti]
MNQQSEDLSAENDRFSDINLSLDEDEFIGQPISSEDIEPAHSEEPDLVSIKNNKLCTLSTIHEESKDISNNPLLKDISLNFHGFDKMSENINNQSDVSSHVPSLVSSTGGSYSKNSKALSDRRSEISNASSKRSSNIISRRSEISNMSSQLSNNSRNSQKRREKECRNVMESIDKLRNISLNDSSHFQRPDSKTSNFSMHDNIINEKNCVKFNPVHQSVGSSFFHQNTTTNSRTSNYTSKVNTQNDNNKSIHEDKDTGLDQIQNMLTNLRKNSVEVKVNTDEVPLSEMKSFKFLNDIIERTTNVFLKDHFEYLNENQAFFEMSPGFLAQYIPETIDEKCTNQSKILNRKGNEHHKNENKTYVELTGRNESGRNSVISNQMEGSCNIKSVDSAAFFAE